ncbi:MAG: carbohydrate binding domain-containing protein [Planctomycetes bacterium]|nr:carbohydrate binding domain-containing protein [Planctomycetota bacterium]MBL7146659.1 carbohydrate binding domain-containing protein [Phycisphaerae bacterium]
MCKRLIYLTCFVFTLAALPSVTQAQVENLAPNPSFEEDEDAILMDDEWFQWSTWAPDDVTGSNVFIVDTESIDGSRSLRVEPVGAENWHLVVANISFPMKTGTDFTATFWAKAEEPRPLGAQFKAADNSVSWGYADFELTTEWAEYTMTSTAGSDEGKLEFFCAASEVPHWLDFVYVYEGEYVAGIEPGKTPKVKATAPDPADGTMITDIWANLSWQPGVHAISHDVYFGDNLNDVTDGAESTFVGNQNATFTVVGFPGFAYPDGLVPGTTYYWRIDEVNEADPNSPWMGDMWSFIVPPKTAYLPEPADSVESVSVDVTLSWTPGFGAKLHTVYFGDNYEEVNNATGGLTQGTMIYNPGTLKMAKTYYWRVDEFDIIDTHKGDVWSFTTEGAVESLNPVNGAVDVTQTPILTWAPGFGATHEVYFGTDAASLEFKGSGNLGSEIYDPGQLEWGTTYYWRIDEADNANADSPWTGPLWSFTTANFLIIDDMESYNDLDEGDPGSNRIYLAWADGFDNPAINGSVVGHTDPPFAEQTIVHSGSQSMPLAYDNAVGKSEATLTLTNLRNWTENGINTLTIWFRGNTSNAAEPMYAALNGSAVVQHDNPDAALTASWTAWNIDLQAFADQGVNLSNVTSVTLGLGNRSNPVAGGTGTVFFDDIRLYATSP